MRKFVRRSLHVVLAAALLVTIYVIVLSIDREYQRTTDLGAGVTLIETVHVFRSAFTVIADSGGSAWIPIPYRSEGVIRQKLLRILMPRVQRKRILRICARLVYSVCLKKRVRKVEARGCVTRLVILVGPWRTVRRW